MNSAVACPLCGTTATHFASATQRSYLRCGNCQLIFVHPAQRIAPDVEIARYRQHNNTIENAGYVAFLMRLVNVIADHVPAGAHGLDYGCGPAPILGQLLTERGFPTPSWDPYFYPDPSVLQQRYDFLTCCEVVEHAADPHPLFTQLDSLAFPDAAIAIMTQLYDDVHDFSNWWYQRDVTHVSFFCAATMQWVARRFTWSMSQPQPNILLFRKQR